ncbi:MAG: ribonuclease R [Candidatus Marinimicrobia bacterium]|jgi:ribonuclease R|nr:ribonuclease R [Candidatus Neomarinimicrobiota bacterium]MBT3947034.1 ribonuclease R [Candidatus Neomarinimicrobiota bacterium]MBT4064996.1 ribonuclease R [Candidatus Neomarinimicrobiota bacterium]MBT4307056.1 ribonuclease R [Candidatus Neomarinimicrobiota bacterium]MBT4453864.1 ribonuclease R [Candidatus Neomarinimicrobiota bacterium]
MRKKLLNIFNKSPEKLFRQKDIIHRMKVKQHEIGAVKILLNELVKSGEIVRVKGNRYTLPRERSQFVGRLTVTQKGFGFVITDDDLEDIFIGRRSMADAIHGDHVRVKLHGRPSPQGLKGRVQKVLERGSNSFIGITYRYAGKLFMSISPVNPDRGIRLIKAKKDLDEGQIVKARVKDWGSPVKPIIAELQTVIGKAEDPVNDMKMILNKYDYLQEFPQKVMEEVKRFSQKSIAQEISNRRDLREWTSFTIDPVDAKDFDDAISIKQNRNGYELGVHIADVSHFVEQNTYIDREAIQRSTSVYFTEGVVHMLPEALSANLCSLRPNEDRLAVSAIMKMDKDFNIMEKEILPTVINSKARFTYQDVQDIVEDKIDHKFKDDILILKRLAKRLFKNRSDAGSIDFDIPEPIFEMGEKGIPHEIRPSERMESHRIVEECMLLANRVVAAEMPKKLPKNYPFVYRVHANPDQKDVVRFTDLLKVLRLGIQIPKGELSPNDIKNVLKHVEDSPYRSLIENVALRTMSKAEYSMKNQGHFGLAFDHYTHFTSPIRRYPDLMVHRMIKMVCNKSIQQEGEWRELMLKSINISNEVELKALSAEREYIKMKQLRWLNERIGETFEGRISGVVNFGIFVELQSSLAEGLIHIDTMEDDDYTYDEDRYCLQGHKTRYEYRLGDKVSVKVLAVLFEKQRANFTLESQ